MGLSPTIYAGSIGIPDTLLLMLLALVVFGPRRLPEIGRQIGKLMYEFRKVSNDFKFQMEEELRASEEADRQKKLAAQQTPVLELNIPPQPTSAILEIGSGSTIEGEPTYLQESALTAETGAEIVPEVGGGLEQGELEQAPERKELERGEPRKFPPSIQPPVGGDPVAAAKPFRGRAPEAEPDTVPETEVGLTETDSGTEQQAHHA